MQIYNVIARNIRLYGMGYAANVPFFPTVGQL